MRIIQQRKPDGIAFDKWELEEKGESKTAKEFIKEENKKKNGIFRNSEEDETSWSYPRSRRPSNPGAAAAAVSPHEPTSKNQSPRMVFFFLKIS